MNNYTKYIDDLEKLLTKGELIFYSLYYKFYPESKEPKQNLPDFYEEYQMWYSESFILIKQLLIDRLDDFKKYYEKPKNRKEINYDNYCIEDALQNLTLRRGHDIIVDPKAAIPKLQQQLAILKSINARFESSLFDITQLLQADLFDSELKMGEELLNKGFIRASGAITGVVLEKHLSQVLKNHNVSITKKQPAINDLNELLKNNNIIDVPTWRLIQRFGDIRNICDHNKDREPTNEEVLELIRGVEKITKTLF
jgi:galactitol-specific phosphotransferase system IIB component